MTAVMYKPFRWPSSWTRPELRDLRCRRWREDVSTQIAMAIVGSQAQDVQLRGVIDLGGSKALELLHDGRRIIVSHGRMRPSARVFRQSRHRPYEVVSPYLKVT